MQRKIVFTTLFIGFLAIFLWQVSAPFSFPVRSVVDVPEGTGLYTLGEKLEEDGVIRSPFWFRLTAIALGGERDMKAGHYYMNRRQNVFMVAWRVFHGDYDVQVVRVTIPEGFNVEEIADLFDERFKFFDAGTFVKLAPEGYLFPDTYFIPVTATATSTIKLLRDNFMRRIFPHMPRVELSGKDLEEIITMASIIENEAPRATEDKAIISGILWKRIELGIPLQVDASFVYVNGKTTKDLTLADLKINSPFNTYLYKGLPPAPISNPGLESIEAALNPANTPYLFFLTGDDGKMHYSRNFDEHVEKKFKYIN